SASSSSCDDEHPTPQRATRIAQHVSQCFILPSCVLVSQPTREDGGWTRERILCCKAFYFNSNRRPGLSAAPPRYRNKGANRKSHSSSIRSMSSRNRTLESRATHRHSNDCGPRPGITKLKSPRLGVKHV